MGVHCESRDAFWRRAELSRGLAVGPLGSSPPDPCCCFCGLAGPGDAEAALPVRVSVWGGVETCGCNRNLPRGMPRRGGGMPPRIVQARQEAGGGFNGIRLPGGWEAGGIRGSSTIACGMEQPRQHETFVSN